MSRYQLNVPQWSDEIVLVVGWDPGLNSYFAQIYRGNPLKDNAECLLWLGTEDIITTVDDLLHTINQSLAEGNPPAALPHDIREQLERDRTEVPS
ncbi:MAG: hypothetical protein GF313_09160 [Caldithrix sp.]|nr:hypothetical protein [Caldithrix sp.]